MNKLTKTNIRKMIMQELAAIVGEDALISMGSTKDEYRRPHNPRQHVTHSNNYDDFEDSQDSCGTCGGITYEGECMECGYSGGEMLEEGGCGCGGSANEDDGSDYSIDTMGMTGDALGTLTHAGYDVNATKGSHKSHNEYMAKPSLYKVAKYAQKLLHMIPDGYELDDWQRTKIAQISDDISEVYHSLDYDFHDEH